MNIASELKSQSAYWRNLIQESIKPPTRDGFLAQIAVELGHVGILIASWTMMAFVAIATTYPIEEPYLAGAIAQVVVMLFGVYIGISVIHACISKTPAGLFYLFLYTWMWAAYTTAFGAQSEGLVVLDWSFYLAALVLYLAMRMTTDAFIKVLRR